MHKFKVNSDQISLHLQKISEVAKRCECKGKLVLAGYGEDPKKKDEVKPKVKHFKPGDSQAMSEAVKALSKNTHRNIYISLCLMKDSLESGKKGGIDDIESVFGLCADFDDDNAAEWKTRLPFPPDYVMETSKGRFQCFYFFSRGLSVAEAKPIAEALQKHTGCDHGTKDLSHVWRVAGVLNWPNAKKVKEGRPAVPQLVTPVRSWTDSYTDVDELREALKGSLPVPESSCETETPTTHTGIVLNPAAEPGSDRLMKLVEIFGGDFMGSWENTKDIADTSPSGYDFSLAVFAAKARWSHQRIADLLIAHRRKNGHDLKLSNRQYYARTINKAIESQATESLEDIQTEKQSQFLEQISSKSGATELKKIISQKLGIEIRKIQRYGIEPPLFTIFTDKGELTLSGAEQLCRQEKLRDQLANYCSYILPKIKPKEWPNIAQGMLDICENIEVPDEIRPLGRTKVWLNELLANETKCTLEESVQYSNGGTFFEDGCWHISLDWFFKWSRTVKCSNLSSRKLSFYLTRLGCKRVTSNIIIEREGKKTRTTRRSWKIPPGIIEATESGFTVW